MATIIDLARALDLSEVSARRHLYDRRKTFVRATCLDFVIEIVRGCDHQKGFQVLPRRCVVQRNFGWMTCWRRLVRDCQMRIDVSRYNHGRHAPSSSAETPTPEFQNGL